jgi:hypothetical protein
MGKQRAIKLNLNRTFTEKEFEQPDAMHIKDGDNTVKFEPACVFDEEGSQTKGRLKKLGKLVYLLPAFILFLVGVNVEGVYSILLLIEGLLAMVGGTIAIAVSFLLSRRHEITRKLILFVDGCLNALKFSESTEGLQIAWTQKEAEEYVKKQIALEQERFKVMKTWQFVIIMGFLVIVLLILVKIGASIGAF